MPTGKTTSVAPSTDEEGIVEELKLKPGTIVKSDHASYEIMKVLGEGGFGAVLKVKNVKSSESYAMKVEPRKVRAHNKLKMEIDILKRVSKERAQSHFASIVDRGKQKEEFVFLVMDLLGPSLADLKDSCPGRIFPLATGLGVGYQCMEAIEDLHKQGFIHRDLKPANFARGRSTKRHVIYILDFGIARKVTTVEGELKTPRTAVGFKGTVRFASIRCHVNLDQGYIDDCQSWLYVLLDLITEGGLPWKRLEGKHDVRDSKIAFRKENRHLLAPKLTCRDKLLDILDYVCSMAYEDPVDYGYIYAMMTEAARIAGVTVTEPFYWENKPSTTKSG